VRRGDALDGKTLLFRKHRGVKDGHRFHSPVSHAATAAIEKTTAVLALRIEGISHLASRVSEAPSSLLAQGSP
jgi:hypothetical protein